MWIDYDGRLMVEDDDLEYIADENGVEVEEVTQRMIDEFGEDYA